MNEVPVGFCCDLIKKKEKKKCSSVQYLTSSSDGFWKRCVSYTGKALAIATNCHPCCYYFQRDNFFGVSLKLRCISRFVFPPPLALTTLPAAIVTTHWRRSPGAAGHAEWHVVRWVFAAAYSIGKPHTAILLLFSSLHLLLDTNIFSTFKKLHACTIRSLADANRHHCMVASSCNVNRKVLILPSSSY